MIDETELTEIHKYASRLQQENVSLKNQLDEYRESIIEVCKCSGFSSWYNFTEWVFRYFKEAPPLCEIATKACIEMDSEPSCRSINRLFSSNQDLPCIEQEQFQSTLSERSLQDTLNNLTNKFVNSEEEDWRNQTLNIAKIRRDGSTLQFSEIEQIVMENVELRKDNSILKKQIESTKESLRILASIIESERKQGYDFQKSSPKTSRQDLHNHSKHQNTNFMNQK